MYNESDMKFDNLKSILQQNPDSVIFARVAEALLMRGKTDEAIRICEEGIRKHPYYVTGHMVLGKCYLEKKMFDLAEKEFKRVLLFEPKHIAAHKYTGDLMKEAGWVEACLKSYGEILKIDPLNAELTREYERLKQEVASEQRVVTPSEEALAISSTKSDLKITQFGKSDQQARRIEHKTDYQQMETSSINIEDDLFVEDDKSAKTIEFESIESPVSENVTSILDDIFDDRSTESSKNHFEILSHSDELPNEIDEQGQFEVSDDSEAADVKKAEIDEVADQEATRLHMEIPDDDILQGIKVRPYDPNVPQEPVEEIAESKLKSKDTKQPEPLDSLSGDETIEFNKIDSMERKALENLKPIADSDLDFIQQEEGANEEGEDFFDALDKEFKTQHSAEDSQKSKTTQSESPVKAEQKHKPATEHEVDNLNKKSESSDKETPEQIIDQIFGHKIQASTETIEEQKPVEHEKSSKTKQPGAEDNEKKGEIFHTASIPGLEDEQETAKSENDLDDFEIPADDAGEEKNHEELDAMIAAVDEASDKSTKSAPTPSVTSENDPQEPRTLALDTSSFEIERDRIVTPTLGEIYAAQGQYAKAVNVFEVLLKKNPDNKMYRDKVEQLKQRINESTNA